MFLFRRSLTPLKLAKMSWIACFLCASLSAAAGNLALTVAETETSITVRDKDQTIICYNKVSPPAPKGMDSIYERSGCLHPVNTPRGCTVTDMFPADHPHQHGIFSAWVNTTYEGQDIDFWNLGNGTGRVLHEQVVATFEEPAAVGFEVDLIHRAAKHAVDVLRERWKITVYSTDSTYHCFDLESSQSALTDKPLVVNKHHYGGMAFRGPTRWVTGLDLEALKDPGLVREPNSILNDQGSDRFKGNHQHTKWVAQTGTIDGQPVTIAVLSHPKNFRAPQAARLHPTKPYFCFAPCVDGEFTIDREHPYKARYRYLLTDAHPDAEWIEQQWKDWSSE